MILRLILYGFFLNSLVLPGAYSKGAGLLVPSLKRKSIFKTLKLQEGDRIKKINQVPLRQKRSLLLFLKKIKPKSKFYLIVERDKKTLKLDYTVVKLRSSSKKRYKLTKISPQKTLTKDEKLLRKYKHTLQQAYTLQIKTIVYDQPDFDAKQIYFIPAAKRVTISRKIYHPPSRFGSFYKIYIKKPKAVGYISEVDVVPQFTKQNKKRIVNPQFLLAKSYKGDVNRVSQSTESSGEKESYLYRSLDKNRFAGLSFGIPIPVFNSRDSQLGIKISGYNLLISHVNMDFNATVDFQFKGIHAGLFFIYDKIQLMERFPLRLGVGLKADFWLNPVLEDGGPVSFILPGSLGFRIPITHFISFVTDYHLNYNPKQNSFSHSSLFALQMPF